MRCWNNALQRSTVPFYLFFDFVQVQKERDELYDKFVASIYEVQQKTGLKNIILEKKLETIRNDLETKEVQLGKVIAAANLDPNTVKQVTQTVDDLVSEKNNTIQDLQYEVARLKKVTKYILY
jgi:pantoate kinase